MTLADTLQTNLKEPQEALARASRQAGPELSVIVPTFNERENVRPLIDKLEAALQGICWEVIFVDDDSPDHTARLVDKIARRDRRVRCVQRLGRRGLSSACVEGALASSARFVAVIDGDLQHDETKLADMLAAMKARPLDVIVGTRYGANGATGDWSENREQASRFATRIAQRLFRTELSDPMSGFFMARRDVFVQLAPKLSSVGFKILLDIFASSKEPLKFEEVGYEFRSRTHGESKLEFVVLWEFFMLLADKKLGRFIPPRLLSFGIVGGAGVFVHLACLALLQSAGLVFLTAHAIATFVAMTFNYLLNNLLTYSDRRLRGIRAVYGWFSFVIACSIGAAANVGVAGYLAAHDRYWALSALAGIAVGTVWNFAITSAFTWKAK